MNSYELSRAWFDFCFENKRLIDLKDIASHKQITDGTYTRGGFYMISSIDSAYVGKSIDYMKRLKSHTYPSSNKIRIDKELNGNINDFNFYLLLDYNSCGINFFTRHMEVIIEQTFIDIAKRNYNTLLNDKIYGHLQII